jgi:hypothetical protein
MLGRKTYSQEELEHAKTAVHRQLAAHKTLVKAVAGATTDKNVKPALEAFDALFFNTMTLVLDR